MVLSICDSLSDLPEWATSDDETLSIACDYAILSRFPIVIALMTPRTLPPGYRRHPLEGGRYIFVIIAPDGSEVPGSGDTNDIDMSFRLAWEHAANQKPAIIDPPRAMSKRVGCFLLSDQVMKEITDDRDGQWARLWSQFMAQCFILRAEHLSFRATTVYHAYCDLFEPCEDGVEVPQYTIDVRTCGGEILEWHVRKCEINCSPKLPPPGTG